MCMCRTNDTYVVEGAGTLGPHPRPSLSAWFLKAIVLPPTSYPKRKGGSRKRRVCCVCQCVCMCVCLLSECLCVCVCVSEYFSVTEERERTKKRVGIEAVL